MKHVGAICGFAIAGMFVMSVWGAFAGAYGIGGGWFAGFCIISIMWFLNHFVGIIDNPGSWVDMALGIGICGTMRDVFLFGGQAGVDSLPTLICVLIGGILGGVTAVGIEKYLAKKNAPDASEDVSM